MDCRQIYSLKELFLFIFIFYFYLSNLRLLELKFDQILGVRTDFEALKYKFSKKIVISGECRALRN